MPGERFEESGYRDELAERLRGIDDRRERRDALAEAKTTHEYVKEASSHFLNERDRRNEDALLRLVDEASTLDGLKDAIADGIFNIPNGFHGLDHGEHLLKRIDMAGRLGDLTLLPDIGDFRRKIAELQGPVAESERISYRRYLEQCFPNLDLTEEELARVEKKLPKGIFATIDRALEETVVRANALPRVHTRFSCAGHRKGEGGGPTEVYIALEGIGDENDAAARGLRDRLNRPHGRYSASMSVGDITTFHFKRLPTEQWIEENGKRSPEELYEESKRKLARMLDAPELLEVSESEFTTKVVSAQEAYLMNHPEAATIPFAPNSRLLANVAAAFPDRLEEEEYQDFLYGPERWTERDELIAGINDDLRAARLSPSR